MKFLILLLSVILSVQTIEVYIGFDDLSGTQPNTAYVDATYNGNWVPEVFDFRTFVDIDAPYPTFWNYSINGVTIVSGTEDFCNPSDSMSPGGIAIQILRNGLGFNDSSCPFKRYTTFRNRSWTFAEAEFLDLDDIFDAAATVLAGASISPNVSTSMQESSLKEPSVPSDPNSPNPELVVADPPPSAGSPSSMKRRRRDSSVLSVLLDTINECVNARFILTAKVN